MSAREEILARVRAATAGAASVPAPPPVRAGDPASGAALLDLFAERVADYRAVVERCLPGELRVGSRPPSRAAWPSYPRGWGWTCPAPPSTPA